MDAVAVLTLNRPAKRNALDDATVLGLGQFFLSPPRWARAVVLAAEGDHFSAGLDLNELKQRDALEGLHHSRMWHHAFATIEMGAVPVVSALKGAVIGGGLELASATHLRVADATTYFALPEGQRGLFVGGGASVRVPRLIGVHRMTDMMLTGRRISASEAADLGLVHYLTDEGQALTTALDLASTIAANSPVTNFAVLQALPRIARSAPDDGFFLEALVAGVAQSTEHAQSQMGAFLAGDGPKVHAATEPAEDEQ
jgi:enoyl-CoA hydratase/carnithine racemase